MPTYPPSCKPPCRPYSAVHYTRIQATGYGSHLLRDHGKLGLGGDLCGLRVSAGVAKALLREDAKLRLPLGLSGGVWGREGPCEQWGDTFSRWRRNGRTCRAACAGGTPAGRGVGCKRAPAASGGARARASPAQRPQAFANLVRRNLFVRLGLGLLEPHNLVLLRLRDNLRGVLLRLQELLDAGVGLGSGVHAEVAKVSVSESARGQKQNSESIFGRDG